MTQVRFHRRKEDHHYAVLFSYDPDVVDLLKRIPAHARSWNPNIKEWRVSDAYADELAEILQRYGHQVVGAAKPPAGRGSGDWAQVLFGRIGEDRIDVVFRVLSKVFHPDNPLTGDTVLQRELNEAREKFRQ